MQLIPFSLLDAPTPSISDTNVAAALGSVFSHAHLHHARECHESAEAGVKHHPK